MKLTIFASLVGVKWCFNVVLFYIFMSNNNIKYLAMGFLVLRLKLKHQYFGHLMQRTDSFEKTLMLGKIEDGRKRG